MPKFLINLFFSLLAAIIYLPGFGQAHNTIQVAKCQCHILLDREVDTGECAPQNVRVKAPPDIAVDMVRLSSWCPKGDTVVSFELALNLKGTNYVYKADGAHFTLEMKHGLMLSEIGTKVIVQNVLISGPDGIKVKLPSRVVLIQ